MQKEPEGLEAELDALALDCFRQALVEGGKPDDASSMMEELTREDVNLAKQIEELRALALDCLKQARDHAEPDAKEETVEKLAGAMLETRVQRRPDLAEALCALSIHRAVAKKIGV